MNTYRIWDEDYDINEYEKHLLERADIPKYQWIEDALVPDKCDAQSYERLHRIRMELKEFIKCDKNNLLICGNNLGCGKTSWAFKLMLTYIEKNWGRIYAEEFEITDKQFDIALFISVPQFIVDIKLFGNNELAKQQYFRAKKTELLILDDIAALEMSKYDYNVIYSILEARNLHHLPTIITTNCVGTDEMSKILGPRLTDRIFKFATIVELQGNSKRGL